MFDDMHTPLFETEICAAKKRNKNLAEVSHGDIYDDIFGSQHYRNRSKTRYFAGKYILRESRTILDNEAETNG